MLKPKQKDMTKVKRVRFVGVYERSAVCASFDYSYYAFTTTSRWEDTKVAVLLEKTFLQFVEASVFCIFRR